MWEAAMSMEVTVMIANHARMNVVNNNRFHFLPYVSFVFKDQNRPSLAHVYMQCLVLDDSSLVIAGT
jgi:hypothetical protein